MAYLFLIIFWFIFVILCSVKFWPQRQDIAYAHDIGAHMVE